MKKVHKCNGMPDMSEYHVYHSLVQVKLGQVSRYACTKMASS